MILSPNQSCYHIFNQHLQLLVIRLLDLCELVMTLENYVNFTLIVFALLSKRCH